MQISVLIVEDEVIIAEDIRSMLEKSGYAVAGVANTYDEAIQLLQEKAPDIALIDINLNDSRNGIELAEHINKQYNIPLIYATSNSDPATLEKAKQTNANGYLLKPFTKNDLYTSIEIAINNFKKNQTENIKIKDAVFIKENDFYVKVLTQDVLFLKSDGNYTEVTTPSRIFVVRGTVKETLNEFDKRFIRIHKSFVINVEKIDAIGASSVIIGKHEIPIGKLYKDGLMDLTRMLK